MNPSWVVRTGRLILRPVAAADLPALTALKADPRVFAVMLGGVRSPVQAAEELARDIRAWGANGVGMWSVRTQREGRFLGITGLEPRADGRGIALRFALAVAAQGSGYAAEAAGAALRFGHDRAGLRRVVAVAREDNVGSRQVLGGIGMTIADSFLRDGDRMLVYESVRDVQS